jgi:hypothetical protein
MKHLFLVLFLGACASCTHKPFIIVVPPVVVPTCDTINVTYKNDIQPVLSSNCYSCHATAVTLNGGLDLEDTASLARYLQYGFRGDGVFGSKFYHCISHSLLALPMPPTYVIDSCSLKKMKHWIDAGAPGI